MINYQDEQKAQLDLLQRNHEELLLNGLKSKGYRKGTPKKKEKEKEKADYPTRSKGKGRKRKGRKRKRRKRKRKRKIGRAHV